MEKSELKRKLFETCIQMQKDVVRTAREAMLEAQENANSEEGSPEEMTESYREQMHQTRDMYAVKWRSAQNDLDLLESVPAQDTKSEVEPGAVVKSSFQHFFIALGMNKVTVGDEAFFPISTSAPIYQAMAGLKKGDSFQFRDRKYEITDIF